MKYFKNPNGEVFAYGSEAEHQEWGAPDLVEMTQYEVDAHLNPPPTPPSVPQQVTNAQGAAALIQAGLWGPVLAYVDAMPDPTEKALAEVALHRTTHWHRTSPFLNAAGAELGLSPEQLDGLFINAAKIEL